jgi:class 3 adenylate cyclase
VKQVFVILVCIDLVDSTRFIESQGDVRASQAMRVYDRIFRGLLIKYNGLEIDKTDGALLIFETMREALAYITEYHALIEHHLKLRSRAGIHCGHVIMHSNNAHFVARGAKPVEVDGIHKVITARVMSLASGGQTLMSKRAGEYAASVRGKLIMRDVGVWRLKGVKAPLKLFAISANTARLTAPRETDKVTLVRPPPLTPRQRWVRRFNLYVMPPLLIYTVYMLTGVLAVLEYFNVISHWGMREAHNFIHWLLFDALF